MDVPWHGAGGSDLEALGDLERLEVDLHDPALFPFIGDVEVVVTDGESFEPGVVAFRGEVIFDGGPIDGEAFHAMAGGVPA